MKFTNKFKLKKPEGSDVVDINDFNGNADIIDEELAKIDDKAGYDYVLAATDNIPRVKTSASLPAELIDGDQWHKIHNKIYDPSESPGPEALFGGTLNAGYFGMVSADELFSGTELAELVGVGYGTPLNDDVGWLKFAIDGKIKYKSQKSFRNNITWGYLNSLGIVDGATVVEKDGIRYKVSLMKGSNKDPVEVLENNFPITGEVHQSEWNRLMLPISERVKTQDWSINRHVKIPVEDWGVYLTDEELGFNDGDGSRVICQETLNSGIDSVIYRGASAPDSVGYAGKNAGSTKTGWSPVLEVIE